MTVVSRTRLFDKQVQRIPEALRRKIQLWVFEVETYGLAHVSRRPGYHDEPLRGQRQGQRSVRLNIAYRLIYRVIVDRVHIELLEVHKHDY